MAAAGHPGLGGEHRDLAAFAGLQHLGETASRIGVGDQGVAERLCRQRSHESGVERPLQAGADVLDPPGAPPLGERG